MQGLGGVGAAGRTDVLVTEVAGRRKACQHGRELGRAGDVEDLWKREMEQFGEEEGGRKMGVVGDVCG